MSRRHLRNDNIYRIIGGSLSCDRPAPGVFITRTRSGRRASAMSAGTAETPTEAQGEARQRGGEAETPND